MDSNPYHPPSSIADSSHAAPMVPATGGWKLVVVAGVLAALMWMVPLLNFLPLAFLGWAASRAWPARARTICRSIAPFALALVGVLVLSGVPSLRSIAGDTHRWTAHGLLIFIYVGVPISIGVLVHQELLRHPISAVAKTLAILFCLAVSFSASVTGYLDRDPVADPAIAEETHSRFVVLHFFVLPFVLCGMLILWHRFFGPSRSVVN